MNKYSYNYMQAEKDESPLEAFLGALSVFALIIILVFIAYLIG